MGQVALGLQEEKGESQPGPLPVKLRFGAASPLAGAARPSGEPVFWEGHQPASLSCRKFLKAGLRLPSIGLLVCETLRPGLNGHYRLPWPRNRPPPKLSGGQRAART